MLRRTSADIPIVMISTPDPVEHELVTNLPRPEGNVTGVAQSSPELISKRIEVLKELHPRLARLAIIERSKIGPDDTYSDLLKANVNIAARRFDFTWESFVANAPEDFPKVFAQMVAGGFDSVYIPPGPVPFASQAIIRELALKHGVATLGELGFYARYGFLLTYGSDVTVNFRRGADFVDKLLRGAKPSELPVEQPTKIRNGDKSQNREGIGPYRAADLLARADEVIE